MAYAKSGSKVTIDGTEWTKTGRTKLFKYSPRTKGNRFIVNNIDITQHVGHTNYLDHAEIFKNDDGEYAVASHVYDLLYSPHHHKTWPDYNDEEMLRRLSKVREFADKYQLDVLIEPTESWYYPKNSTLLFWTKKQDKQTQE
jgi:hypothetical protein